MPGPYACSTSLVCQKLVCCSCVCHGLEAHLCILSLILDLLWRELFPDFPFFIGLLLSKAGPCLIIGFPLFSPSSAPSVVLLPFLPYLSAIPTMMLFNPCLLGLFGPVAYSSLNDSIWSLDLYSCYFRLFLTHYIACGLFCPISFFLSILGPFGFLTFLLHFFGSVEAHSHFSTSHNAHGFTMSLFGLF